MTTTARKSGYALTTPCHNCPFRNDIDPYLRAERAREIAASLRNSGEFTCHKTVTFGDDDDEPQPVHTGREQQCAGAAIILEKEGMPGQMMRISERLGLYDRDRLDMQAPVYESLTAWVHAQDGGTIPTVIVDGEVLEFEHCGIVAEDCEDPAGYGGSGGAWENDEPPTCHPIDDCCSWCGSPMCSACRADDDRCVTCAEDDEGEAS
jgi:hypothetical protein